MEVLNAIIVLRCEQASCGELSAVALAVGPRLRSVVGYQAHVAKDVAVLGRVGCWGVRAW